MWLQWFGFIIPVCFTPGPVTITCAGVSARYGAKAVIPFLIGVNAVNFVFCTIGALSMEGVAHSFPKAFEILKIFGGLFILYLGWKFLRTARNKLPDSIAKSNAPTVRDGILLNVTNVKSILVFAVPFAQFIDHSAPREPQVSFLVVGIIACCFAAQASWTFGGRVLARVWKNSEALSYFFAFSLFTVGIWNLWQQIA